MLESIQSWMKDIFHKTRGLSGPHDSPKPLKSILKIDSSTNAVDVSTTVRSAATPRTPRISFMIPPSESLPLRRSPGSSSPLRRYDLDRTDASRTAVPLLTSTSPSDLRRTALLAAGSRQRATKHPNTPRRIITPTGPPGWFPSGTISMTSRTTHQTYSTNPSLLFTGSSANVLSPLTSAIFTPEPTPETVRVLKSDTTVVKNLITTVDPFSQERTAQRDATAAEMIANPIKRELGEKEVWFKVAAPSLLPATPVVARDMVRPSITIRPPTPSNAQTIDGVHTVLPMIPDAIIVDSPEGSVASWHESAHTSDSCKAAAASDSAQSCRSGDGNVADLQVSFTSVSPSGRMDNVQSNYRAPETVNLVTPVDGMDIVDGLQPAEAGVANVQNTQWQERQLPSASRTPSHIHISPNPWLPPPVSQLHMQVFGPRSQMVETQEAQMMEHADLDSHKPDPMHQIQLNNNPDRPSTPISQLDLVRPPPGRAPQVVSSRMPAHINYIMTPSVNQVPHSVVGPNALLFATNHLLPTEFVPDFPSCPRYPALSINDFLPFRRPELFLPPPPYLSNDKELWWTSDSVEIPKNDFPPWLSNRPDDRPRRYTNLGMISRTAGKFKYLVYNRKSRGHPHTMTLISPTGMDPVQLQFQSNHVWFLQYLAQLPICGNLAVFYDGAPVIWFCPDEYIWYLSPHECGTLDAWNGAVENCQMPLIIRDLASGLKFLHKHYIVHWDLRAHNIFIDRAGYCLIGNFERAVLLDNISRSDCTMEGRHRLDNFSPHTAPELLRHGIPLETYRFNQGVDMWALGMIVCELQAGKIDRELPCTLSNLKDEMVIFNAPPELLHLTFEGFLVESFRDRAKPEAVLACQYLREACESGAPPFLFLDIPPLLPDAKLPAMELNQYHHYMARRQARQRFEQNLGYDLPCDEAFLVGRDC